MSGIVDVARAAGVSPTTVSRALRGLPGVSDATRETVQEAATRLGYFPSPTAAALPTGRTNAIGVLVPWISRWFFTAVIDGAQDVVAGAGYDMLLYAVGAKTSHPPEAWDVRSISKRVDGILALSIQMSEQQVAMLNSSDAAVVSIGPELQGFCRIRVDDVEVGRSAAAHLIRLGHRTVGFIGGDPADSFGLPVAPDRLSGAQITMAEIGCRIDPQHVLPAEFSVEGGIAAFAEFARIPEPPTAVLAACDEIAIGLIHAARAAGWQVPGDLSVIGVDGHDLAELFGLTTVSQPVREEGRLAAEMLLDGIGGKRPSPPRLVTLPTTLIERETTGIAGLQHPVPRRGALERATRIELA